ncbi:hypothetical protein [Roseateles saccharophilus]|uniref:Uncharacterized protein n=1 Tax=Roseateles saccharophilus TaxID=304 RepID=A0A4V2VQZ9_ROSSA|nr:hypothetical protein [Roseateles saccharophilus]MDG0833080.1 hypothetical protein [Roseateles saccharophilus]TCU96279.1 hypothetical protein EV671_101346 [Roseateles saccharophilus]
MKIKLIAIATLAAANSAQALSPTAVDTARANSTLKEIRLTGSSSYRFVIAGYVQTICRAGTIDVFHSAADLIASGDGEGSGARAYSCTLATALGNYAAGTPVLIHKRDTGGAIFGVANVATNDATTKMMKVSATSCSQPTAYTDITTRTSLCSQTEQVAPDAGISDIEPPLLNQSPNLTDNVLGDPQSNSKLPVDLSTLTVQPYMQVILGVAVNLKAYRALQATQGLDTAKDDDANRPSLPRTWIRTAMTGAVDTSADGLEGWGLVLGTSGNGKTVNICRENPGSGTQAAAQMYFLNNTPCDPGHGLSAVRQATATKPLPNANGSTPNTIENLSEGDALACLTNADNNASTAYALGIFSKGNVEAGTKWRYVRLDGALPNRYISGSMPSGAVNVSYDFVAEGTMQWNTAKANANADLLAALNAIVTQSNTPAAIAALPVTSSANSLDGVMASPLVWFNIAPFWSQLTSAQKPYASRLLHAIQSNGVSDSCSAYTTF